MTLYIAWKIKLVIEYPQRLVYNDYTAKLLKTLLIKANPRLEQYFQPQRGAPPKPIHITALFVEDTKTRALYPHTLNPQKPPKLVTLEAGKPYTAYLGARQETIEELGKALAILAGGIEIQHHNEPVAIRLVEISQTAHLDTTNPPTIIDRKTIAIKAVWATPTIPANPWNRETKHRPLLPAPSYIFAVNALELSQGNQRKYEKLIKIVEKVLQPTYAALKTTKITWYKYEKKLLPALIGYTKYMINQNITQQEIEQANLILAHAMIMGAGTGRAAGFGHVKIQVFRL
ncbi:MAG TPA: CRISPR system precrRNA processing endoribonuclease RAMP protein Cas6 [Pyrodictium sp.]|nr:CRISPR system precrRNA processing endoribonuclease RAMP protein Cas6 [Pyrodictium sp.]